MKILVLLAGALLALDGCVTWLLLLVWAARGHLPDFVTATAFGFWSMVTVAAKAVAGPAAAIQLWRLKPSGRAIGIGVLANNVPFTLAAALHAGKLEAVAWATMAVHGAALLVLALPAAREACRE